MDLVGNCMKYFNLSQNNINKLTEKYPIIDPMVVETYCRMFNDLSKQHDYKFTIEFYDINKRVFIPTLFTMMTIYNIGIDIKVLYDSTQNYYSLIIIDAYNNTFNVYHDDHYIKSDRLKYYLNSANYKGINFQQFDATISRFKNNQTTSKVLNGNEDDDLFFIIGMYMFNWKESACMYTNHLSKINKHGSEEILKRQEIDSVIHEQILRAYNELSNVDYDKIFRYHWSLDMLAEKNKKEVNYLKKLSKHFSNILVKEYNLNTIEMRNVDEVFKFPNPISILIYVDEVINKIISLEPTEISTIPQYEILDLYIFTTKLYMKMKSFLNNLNMQ